MRLLLQVNGETNDIADGFAFSLVKEWAMQRVTADNEVDVSNADTGEVYFEVINGKVTHERDWQ